MRINYPQVGMNDLIKQLGKTAYIITWTKKKDLSGDEVRDEYNNVVWEENRRKVTLARAFQTNTKVPVKVNAEQGQYLGFDFEFYTADDVSEFENLGAFERKPEIEHEGRRHRISDIEPSLIGVSRIICEQKRQ